MYAVSKGSQVVIWRSTEISECSACATIYCHLLFCLALRLKDKRAKENVEFKSFFQQEHLFPAADGSVETIIALMCLEFAV